MIKTTGSKCSGGEEKRREGMVWRAQGLPVLGLGGGLPVRETQEDSVHHVQGLKSSHVAELRLV